MIAVICAMKEEKDAVLALMSDTSEIKKASLDFTLGKLGGKDIVLCECGVGKTYASILTTVIIKEFDPELLVCCGCAGSTNKDVHVGDLVVADKIGHHDPDIPWPKWKRGWDSEVLCFPCSKKVIDSISDLNVKVGGIATGESFIYKKEQVETILEYYPGALCAEMEGASIAQTCAFFNKECTIIRSISDETLVNGDFNNFDFNLVEVCEVAAKVCETIISRY